MWQVVDLTLVGGAGCHERKHLRRGKEVCRQLSCQCQINLGEKECYQKAMLLGRKEDGKKTPSVVRDPSLFFGAAKHPGIIASANRDQAVC